MKSIGSDPQVKEKKMLSVQQDVGLSVIIAPCKYFVPIVGYIILYPLILRNNGIAVLGLWSLLRTITSYFSLSDVGFSLLLTREAGVDRTEDELSELYKDYIAAQRAYIFICMLLLSLLFASNDTISILLKQTYPREAVLLSCALLVISATIFLLSRLDAAILSARNENYYVQLVIIIIPIFTFTVAICGAMLGFPIEGLSLGTLIASIVQIFAYRRRLRTHHSGWMHNQSALPWRMTSYHIKSLIRRGWQFYSISLGMMLRDPSFNWILAYLLGLEVLGIYSIAQRVTVTARDIVASGFTSLLPSLSFFHRMKKEEDTFNLIQISLIFSLSVEAGIIGILFLVSDIILPLWLGEVHEGIYTTIRILGIWYTITVASIPFWYLLQASGYERQVSLSVWIHTLAIFILIPLNQFINFGMSFILIYWVITGLFCQLLIYFYVERKLSIFWEIVLKPRVIINTIVVSIFLIIAIINSLTVSSPESSSFYGSLSLRLIPIILYAAAIASILKLPVQEYLFKKQKIVVNPSSL